MRSWRSVIVVLFACAALLGGMLSGASAATAVAPEADEITIAAMALACAVDGATSQASSFHACGKLRNGMAVQCHSDDGVLPAAAVATACDVPNAAPPPPARLAILDLSRSLYRPPRTA